MFFIISRFISLVSHITAYIVSSVLVTIVVLFGIGLVLLAKENKKKAIIQDRYDTAQQTYMVVLVQLGNNPLHVIKVLRKYTTWDLALAKAKIELPLPTTLIPQLPADMAHELKQELATVNTIVELVENR